jgi:hypothetical protein
LTNYNPLFAVGFRCDNRLLLYSGRDKDSGTVPPPLKGQHTASGVFETNRISVVTHKRDIFKIQTGLIWDIRGKYEATW